MKAESGLTELKGVGEKTAELFRTKGIETAADLLNYYPRDYEYYDDPVTVSGLIPGRINTVIVFVRSVPRTVWTKSRMSITSFKAEDATGSVNVRYYNFSSISRSFVPGMAVVLRGRVSISQAGKSGMITVNIDQPSVYKTDEYEALRGKYLPVYSLWKNMSNNRLIKMVSDTLKTYEFSPDYMSRDELERYELIDEETAVRKIHFPSSKEEMIKARNRKVFDEFFGFLLSIKREKETKTCIVNEHPMVPVKETKKLLDALPYKLTGAQLRAFDDISSDLCSEHVMNRLLQGDVGSGKTIVAFLSLLMCACNNRQGALMAPTEVLARQHMINLEKMIKEYSLPLRPVLLTGSVKGKERRRAYSEIAAGDVNVIIGTHALIQEKVEYKDLGLVITDEQHRFGVRQREALAGKGMDVPVLVMSATPIPRTLAIILYGDLTVSRLDEMPGNRLRIKNIAMGTEQRPKALKFIKEHIEAGEQVYVICPAIDEDNQLEGLENVTDYSEKLKKVFGKDVRIASLNGKMKPAQKNEIMAEFASHEIDILVSTTVIEVGIDVPNATVIMIENAERFGMSQLHQLRGRVGRGGKQSYCIFLYSAGIEKKPKRLEILEKNTDGFLIAEEDLKLRGPGDMFGVRQSGEMGFRLADIYEDASILEKASESVDRYIRQHPLETPEGLKSVDFRSI